jgi:hypothetical protein
MDIALKGTQTMLLFLLIALAFFMGGAVGVGIEKKSVEKRAIDAGVARYTVDEKTGEVTFEFTKGQHHE